MKKLLLIFLTALSLSSFGQGLQLAEVTKVWHRKNVVVKDGMTYKYITYQNSDTARYYITGSDTFQVTVVFNKVGTAPSPIVTQIDGEQATFSSSPAWSFHGIAAANTPGWFNNTIAYSNAPGSWASYTFTGRRIKLFAETKPTHGTGVVVITRGTQVIKSGNVNFVSLATTLPAQIYDSGDLGSDTYKFELKISSGYGLWDYVEITR